MMFLANRLQSLTWRFLLMLALVGIVVPAQAASPEKLLLTNAVEYFKDKFYFQAETRFTEFVNTYTNSPERPSAVLYQARCRLYQSNFLGAIDLLRTELSNAGKIEDQYHYWIAESLVAKGDFKEAVTMYEGILRDFPKPSLPTLRLAAAFGEAQAYCKLSDWPHAIYLLSASNEVFQTEARTAGQSGRDSALSGYLLLGEALFEQKNYGEAEKVISNVPGDMLDPRLAWHRQHLLCRLQLAAGHVEQALQTCTNRLAILTVGQSSDVIAETTRLKAEILERLERWQEAVEAYTNNLSEKFTPAMQRQALFKTINLTLKQNQPQEAIRLLENFTEQRTNAPSLDLARLMLGELALKAWYTRQDTGSNSLSLSTNLMLKAMTNFDRVIQEYPNGPLLGKAYLDQGWCYWAQTNYTEAAANFQTAVDELSKKAFSEDLAVARFKLADTQFCLKDYGSAVTNYTAILVWCDEHPELKRTFFEKSLYQILRGSIERDDLALADETVKKIVSRYPVESFDDQSALLYGEFKNRRESSAEARQIFTDLLKKLPNTKMRPEVEYAIARTYAMQADWAAAAKAFSQWSTTYSNHWLLSESEFSKALAFDKAGDETNAFVLLTNYVTRFPSNHLAAWAQNWVADWYFNNGKYTEADLTYQELLRKFPNAGDLTYQARLMSGRSAYARQGPLDIQVARDCFTDLAVDTNTPSAVAARAYFALGDINLQLFREKPDSTNRYCDEAVKAFRRIPATNSLAVLAQGRIGDCMLEWYRHTPPPEGLEGLTNAFEAYTNVLALTDVNDSAHCQALVQLGTIAEIQNNQPMALTNYLKVLYETQPDRVDSVWVNQAGVAAARICEASGQWTQAISVYNRVLRISPSLKPILDKKISTATAMVEATRK